MKQSRDSSPADSAVQELKKECAELGLEISPSAAADLVKYLSEIIRLNESVNLTRITDLASGVRLHVVDSLCALPELEQAPQGAALDLGTGGGFPGVPLAVVSGRPFVLLDSTAKKARAVSDAAAAAQLGVNIRVVSARAEELAAQEGASYAAVVARAVAALPSLLELAAPLLEVGGRLITLKGCPESSERESGTRVAARVGLSQVSERQFSLPGGGETRTILVFEKTRESTICLPRRTGLAQTHPLA